MPTFSLLNPTIHVHDFDFAGFLNKMTIHTEADELDVTTWPATYRSRIGGLKTVAADGAGFWDSTPDLAIFSALGVMDRVITVSPQGAEANIAYLWQMGRFSYDQFGSVGEAAPFAFSSMNSNGVGMVRGQMAKAKGNVSATGQLGSVLTLTAPTATQFVYGSIHIFSPAGTTITLQLQSDDNLGFSSPTTRGTVGPLTTTGGTFTPRVAGPFAGELYWRWNVSAITGTFLIAAAIGVQ